MIWFEQHEKKIVAALFVAMTIVFAYISLISPGVYGGADNFIHYRLSRYSFSHPEFFLDHWGKPLFTLLSSPFSQFGFNGLKIFNILIGVAAAFFSYKTAKLLRYKNALLAMVFTCFLPIFFIMMFTGMTEILFAFVVVVSVYLFLSERYYFAAIVISFLPFARTEGIVILPCFFLALLLVKKWKAIPFLGLGTLLYSIVGGFYYHDFLWVITKSPYGDARAIYGHGGPFDFIKAYEEITGKLFAGLLILGSIFLMIRLFFKNKESEMVLTKRLEFLLILSPVVLYFLFHSFLWWKGMGGSLGLTRVMAGIMPLVAILSLKGWNLVDQFISFNKWLKVGATGTVLFFIIKSTTGFYPLPIELNPPQQLVKEASDWLKESQYFHKKMYYYDPFFVEAMDLNPYDSSRVQELVNDPAAPEKGLAIGSIILWDAHLTPNEGRLPLDRLKQNEHFQVVKIFQPAEPFTVLGGYQYEIDIVQKIK